MKAIIWVCCCLVFAIISTTLLSVGVQAGFLLTAVIAGSCIGVATALCKKVDEKESERRAAIEEQQPEPFDFTDLDSDDSTIS